MPDQYLHGARVVEIDSGARPIQTVATAIIGIVGTAPNAEGAASAVATFGTGTSLLTLTAATAGIAGNTISCRLANPSANSASLSVAVSGNAITVNLATNSSGVVTSTAAAIATALAASTPATALVTASYGGDGSGVAAASVTKILTGGLDESFPLNVPFLVTAPNVAARAGSTGTLPKYLADIQAQTNAVVVVVRVAASSNPTTQTSNVIAGISQLLNAESTLGIEPKILIAPEFSQSKIIADALSGAADTLLAFAFADGPNTTDSEAILFATKFASKRLAVIDPWLTVSGEIHAPSGVAAALTAKQDTLNGFWWTPSNIAILGFDGFTRSVSYRNGDPSCTANLLNAGNVTTLINRKGMLLWGDRTTAADPKWQFIAVVRISDAISASISRAIHWAADRPKTRSYFKDVAESVKDYLRTLEQLGAILGGDCWTIDEKNTNPTNAQNGKAFWAYNFTPVYPAEQLIFESILVTDYLVNLTTNNS